MDVSTKRITKTIPADKLPKGANGRNLCRWCKIEVPKGRRTFCSNSCVHEYSLRANPGYMRANVERRDKGVCSICGLDTRKLERIIKRLVRRFQRYSYEKNWARRRDEWAARARLRLEKFETKYGWAVPNSLYSGYVKSLFDADHIVPVVEGGGECGLENIRTLCKPCHRKVTKELRQRLKQKRLEEKAQQELFYCVAQSNKEDTMTNL